MAAASKKEYVWLGLIGAILIAAVLLVHRHADTIKSFIDLHPAGGLFLYLLLNVLDAVLAPGVTLPLIPLAAHVWGRVIAGLATTAGWTAGSLIAFLIARRWGYPIVRKVTSIQRVRGMRRYIPEDLFWSIVLVRLILPMDIISYVLGLFTEISWSKYVMATAIGLTPSAFLLAYLGKLPNAYEIFAVGIAGAVVVMSVLVARRKRRSTTSGKANHRGSVAGK
jgi:uncharacterized membrane protein YdjX (TVP38/TMEM64 family)